jgi:putative ABC transport system permease protein
LRLSELEQYRLTPLRETHLTSDQFLGMTPGGSWSTVYGLSAIALLIVIIACCNFTNLATARATLRAREIAIRKVGGAKRGELIVQLLVEAVLFSVASLVVALALVEVALPLYGGFLGRPIALHYLADWQLLTVLVAAAIAVGQASGIYPALVLSRFRPALSLRSRAEGFGSPGWVRSALVVVQFAISTGLGITALVVVRQVDFARKVDLGFDRDGVVVVRGIAGLTPSTRESLATTLKANPQVAAVSYSNAVPFELNYVDNDQIRLPGDPVSVAAQVIDIDPEFPSLYGMRLLAGRFLSEQRGEDLTTHRTAVCNMLINAAGVRRLGFSPDAAVGKTVSVGGRYTARIVGVLSDTKLQGMRNPVPPELFYFDKADPHAMRLMSLRVRGELAPETLSFIDRTWRSFVPGAAINRYYLSETFDKLFQPDEKQGQILGLFVGIAIFIACLGLIGLAVFTAERRTKEIGVRKIAGARTQAILSLMLWRISVPVLIANLIAWPLAYYYLNRWLESYAYRIALSPAYFLAGAAAALLAAWATVFAHTLRLARASPIHALRYE